MFKINGEIISADEVVKYFEHDEDSLRKAAKVSKVTHEVIGDILRQNANELVSINDAILNGRDFNYITVREPKDLSKGFTYFTVYFLDLDSKGQPYKRLIFAPMFMGQSKRYGWIFKSNVIGASRVLDATDYMFATIRHIGGSYIQLN